MKIFQIIQKPQARGVELFTALLSEELQKLGHEVILISIFEGNTPLPFSGKQIHLKRPIQKRFWDWNAWNSFSKIIKEESPDIIQANAADTLKFAVFSKKIFGWNSRLVFRNASIMSTYIKSSWVKKFNYTLLNEVQGVVSVSHASQLDLIQFFNLPSSKLEVIPIGINFPNFKELKESQGITELIHIGGFTFEKNHHQLLDIFESLSKNRGDLRLKLIGDGPLFKEIKAEIKRRNLDENVVLLGSLPNPFSHVSKNSIFLLPSRIEGLPSVILEAMYLKTPVVAYGVGGIPEVLKNGETGWCVPPNDQNGFIKAIEEVIAMDEDAKETIISNAFQLVTSNYSLQKVALQFEEFYKRLLNSPPK
jgi:glycosyltransferase involved in cell wall biosynthesis